MIPLFISFVKRFGVILPAEIAWRASNSRVEHTAEIAFIRKAAEVDYFLDAFITLRKQSFCRRKATAYEILYR